MKLLKTIIAIVLIIAIGLAIYWYFDREQRVGDNPGGSGGINIGDFFPFGGNDDTPETPDNTNPGTSTTTTPGTDTNSQIPVTPPRLWKISTEPQSGAIFTPTSSPIVRYVDRATGNVFESQLKFLGTKRISNTTVPKVYNAIWLPKGDSVILQYLAPDQETVLSRLGNLTPIPTASTTEETRGLFEMRTTLMPENLESLSVNAAGALAYTTENQTGISVAVTNTTGTSPRQIFSSPIRDYAVSWINNTTLGLQPKPTAVTPGYFYFLNVSSGRMDRIMGNISGLTTLINAEGTKAVYSESQTTNFKFTLVDIKTMSKMTLPFVTLPEKCVWSKRNPFLYCARPKQIPSGQYPDHWYQGKVSFDDTFWKIDTSTGATELIIDPATIDNAHVDAIDLALDPTENYLIFTNKKDSQLWGLRLTTGS